MMSIDESRVHALFSIPFPIEFLGWIFLVRHTCGLRQVILAGETELYWAIFSCIQLLDLLLGVYHILGTPLV